MCRSHRRLNPKKTEKREYERLLEIRDNYPKYVLRTDEFAGGNYQGIKSMHIADFSIEHRILTMRAAVSRPFYIARFLIEMGDLAIFLPFLQVHMQGDIHYSSAH